MKLIIEEKIKKRSAYPCNDCKIDIEKGETYISAIYNDGYRQKLFGAYHIACWAKSADNPKAKKPSSNNEIL